MRYRHDGPQPVNVTNGYGGPLADAAFQEPDWETAAAEIGRDPDPAHREDDDFGRGPLAPRGA
jgi:hypothetical protein